MLAHLLPADCFRMMLAVPAAAQAPPHQQLAVTAEKVHPTAAALQPGQAALYTPIPQLQ
jgi:hypothetical protein